MKHERKKSTAQFYLPKAKPDLINIPKDRDRTSESTTDDSTDDGERSSVLQQRNLMEDDIAKRAHRHAVNYAKSLLLF